MKLERNPNANKFELPEGYKDLGYQMGVKDNPEFIKCIELGHNDGKHWRKFDNSLYKNRCTDIITICDECKIVWHTDMSD